MWSHDLFSDLRVLRMETVAAVIIHVQQYHVMLDATRNLAKKNQEIDLIKDAFGHFLKDRLIDFNGNSTHQRLFYVLRLENCVYYTSTFTFFM